MSPEDHGNGLGTLGLTGPSKFYNTEPIVCEGGSAEPTFPEMGMRSEIAIKQLRETSSSMKHAVNC